MSKSSESTKFMTFTHHSLIMKIREGRKLESGCEERKCKKDEPWKLRKWDQSKQPRWTKLRHMVNTRNRICRHLDVAGKAIHEVVSTIAAPTQLKVEKLQAPSSWGSKTAKSTRRHENYWWTNGPNTKFRPTWPSLPECTRNTYDIFNHAKVNNLPGMMLMIDFEKAFDSVDFWFLIATLEMFGFGEYWNVQ